MSENVKKVMTIANMFNQKSIDFYNECDLLKQGEDVQTWVSIHENFSWEEYEVNYVQSYLKVVGMCINSIPFFCRYEEHEKEYGSILATYHYSGQKIKTQYDLSCPKCGWGVSAYLAIRCKYDDEFGVCHYDCNGNVTKPQTTFEAYLQLCRKVYYLIPDAKGKTQYDRWKYYKANDNVEAIKRLEAAFLQEHLAAETRYRQESGEVDRLLFAGQLDSVVSAYLDFVQGKIEVGAREKKQEADKWVITDECLIVFGNSESASSFLDSVIGKHYNITMYGKSMKAYAKEHGITKQYGFGKKVWLLICANDNSMNPESDDTFTSAW